MHYINISKSQLEKNEQNCFCSMFSSQQIHISSQKIKNSFNKISLKKHNTKMLKFAESCKLQYQQSGKNLIEKKVNSTFQHSKYLNSQNIKADIVPPTRQSQKFNNSGVANNKLHTLEHQNQIKNLPKRRHQRHFSTLACAKTAKQNHQKSLEAQKKNKNIMNIFFSYENSITYQSLNTTKSYRQSFKDHSQSENFSVQSFINNFNPQKQIQNKKIQQQITNPRKMLSSAKLVRSEYSDSEQQEIVSQIIQMTQRSQNQFNSKEFGLQYIGKQFVNSIQQFNKIQTTKI